MTSPVRRLVLAVGFALAWYVFVWAVLASASYLFGDAYDLLWLWKTLLFPLGLLSWLEVNLTQSFGVARGGHEVLTEPLRTVVRVAIPVLHFAFVTSVAYVLLGWRRNNQGARVNGRA